MFSIGIIIYPRVEVLDFCGPFEVFRNLRHFQDDDIEVFTVSETTELVDAQGLVVVPTYDFKNCPELDILVIPGGNGTWLKDQKSYQNFLVKQFENLKQLVTVCTGALLPATAGIYPDGIEITTHQSAINQLGDLSPSSVILPEVRFTESDKIITSGGISAGIDASLYTVEKYWGKQTAVDIARYMEYFWNIDKPNMIDPALVEKN